MNNSVTIITFSKNCLFLRFFFIFYTFFLTLSCSDFNLDKTVEYKNGLNKKNNADISIPHIAPLFYIVFDQSQEQVYSPFETGYSGMSQLTVSLKKIGASVSINSLPLEKFLENYSGKGKILVLGVAVNRRYRQAEITALENFIKSGGSILVIVEHEDFFGNITFQNDFIKKFGITALSLTSLAEGNNFRTQQWVFCSSKIWNSENVELYYPAPLHIDSGVRILLEMNNPKDPNLKITAALNDLNRGKIVVLGDAEILWNMTEPIGNNAENNKDFLLKLFVYLSGIENSNTSYLPDSGKQNYISSIIHKYKYQVINSENDFNNKNISKKVLIDASAYGLVPDNSPGGLDYFAEFLKMEGYSIEIALDTVADYSEYDLVVNAVSLDKSSINSEIINSKRILLAADGQTDIMNDTMLQLILRGYFSVRYNPELHISPMNIIASFYNIKFPDYTIVSDEKNRFFINGTIKKTGEKFGLKRSGVITGKNNRLPYDFINIAAAEKNYILINNFTPMQTGKKSGNSFFENAIISDPPELTVMAASEKVFAISDFDLLTNQFFYTADGQKVFAAVMDWLNNPEKYKHNWFQKIFGM